ncbi:SDR family oxidoreductase [Rhizosaccharibacter radicis]|uniref:SDR family oxidoreductase n=1 Tax=Rhizosaccharibacter radicis TaxID=2782605 RepID=A0ABT1W2E0_9PROT|nr:SDR family oxidoreductase [Acetobacteraceae bacterium KSS12]
MRSLSSGYAAVVFGATGGIGAAVLSLLRTDPGCALAVGLSRADGLDLEREDRIAALAARLRRETAGVTLLFDATGALAIDGAMPEKGLAALDPVAMARQFAVNAIGPALLFKHFAPLIPRDRRALFATLSARVGSIGDNRLGGWISYRAAKAALNQVVRTAAIEIARRHPHAVVAALHPGTVRTRLSDPFAGDRARLEPSDAARRLLGVLDGLEPARTGCFLAYDGGEIPW